MQERVLEIGGKERAHRHDVRIQPGEEITQGIARAARGVLGRVRALPRDNAGVQILHACGEVVRVVCFRQARVNLDFPLPTVILM
jgi:hypothetical protein